MALQLLAGGERLLEPCHHGFLLRGQPVGVGRVERGEYRIRQRVLHAVHHDGPGIVVDLVQEHAV